MLFTPTPMRQVNIFLGKSDVERVTIALARLGEFHLSVSGEEQWSEDAPRWRELADKFSDGKQRLEGLMDALDIGRHPTLPPQQLTPSADEEDLQEMLQQVEQALQQWQKQKEEAEEEKQRLNYLIHEMHLLEPIETPIEQIRNPEYMHWVVGTMFKENLETLRFALFDLPQRRRRLARTPMRKMNIFLPDTVLEPAASALVQLDNFNLDRTEAKRHSEEMTRWQELAADYADYSERLQGLFAALHMDRPSLPSPERVVPSENVENISRALAEAEHGVEDWQRRKEEVEQEVEGIESLMRDLQMLENLEIPIEELRNPQYLHWLIGKLPRDNLENLRITSFRIPAVIIPIRIEAEQALVIVACEGSQGEILKETVKHLFLYPVSVPENMRGSPSEVLQELKQSRQGAAAKLAELDQERARLAQQYHARLFHLWQLISANRPVAEAIVQFARQGKIFLASGWVPEHAVNEVMVALEDATGGHAEIEVLESAGAEREVPIEVMLFRWPLVVIPVAAVGDRLLVIGATAHAYADILDRALGGVFMNPVPLPKGVSGTPADVLAELQRRLSDVEELLVRLAEERTRLRQSWETRIFALWRQVSANLQIAETIGKLSRYEDTFLISGWISEVDVAGLTAAIEATTEGRADIEVIRPQIGGPRKPPTRLRNPKLFRPFEAIVRTFGSPDYHEIDPTPLTAVSFTLMYGMMYGMMFGDVGQGMLLAFLGLLLNWQGKGLIRSLGGVLMASGLAGTIFGFLYGSFFGLENIVPSLWLRPLQSIFKLLAISVMGGIVVVSMGFLACLINSFRGQRWGRLVFDQNGIAGFWLYASLIGGGYAVVKGILSILWLFVLILPPATLLFLRKPLQRLLAGERPLIEGGMGIYGVEAGFELFEIVMSDFSNTLSFVRLGAFAIAHAGLMRIIYLAADHAGGLAALLIILLGTILVVGFEGLIVGIQALRLQYYEFFGKFFQGRGFPFRPLQLFKTQDL